MHTKEVFHKSVLVNEVLHYLAPQPNKTYLDVTFGGGGHTRAILDHEPQCSVIAIDWDKHAIERNAPALRDAYGERFRTVWGNFAHLYKLLKKEGISSVDGILADFGTSQFQIHERAGFSFQTDSPLDMRMSPSHYHTTAADILNQCDEKALVEILQEYGEEPKSRTIARAIIEARKRTPFVTTGHLVRVIEETFSVPAYKSHHGIHPATRTFQALRIAVNSELENIKIFLPAGIGFLNRGGRMVCISFHSLEDRIVKTFFKSHQDSCSILTTKPVIATPEEVAANPSSRSAKLRAAEKM
jgi:16S rRNA (cytosine1402-N4)-methyltransferase